MGNLLKDTSYPGVDTAMLAIKKEIYALTVIRTSTLRRQARRQIKYTSQPGIKTDKVLKGHP